MYCMINMVTLVHDGGNVRAKFFRSPRVLSIKKTSKMLLTLSKIYVILTRCSGYLSFKGVLTSGIRCGDAFLL